MSQMIYPAPSMDVIIVACTGRWPKHLISRFRRAAWRYYGLSPKPPSFSSWCHMLSRYIPEPVAQAVHLVPKELHPDWARDLIEGRWRFRFNPRNALCLAQPMKVLFDEGVIIVAPVPGETTSPPEYRCVVVDESWNEEAYTFYTRPGWESVYVKDLHNRPLQFLSGKRPDPRFLFFNFILTYLFAKRRGRSHITEKIERGNFWPSGAAGLHIPTLQELAWYIAGCDIPDHLLEEKTIVDSPGMPDIDREERQCDPKDVERDIQQQLEADDDEDVDSEGGVLLDAGDLGTVSGVDDFDILEDWEIVSEASGMDDF